MTSNDIIPLYIIQVKENKTHIDSAEKSIPFNTEITITLHGNDITAELIFLNKNNRF